MKNWPSGIYLETSVLKPLPLGVVNAELERLLVLAQAFGCSVFVPEVSYLEWLRQRQDYLDRLLHHSHKSMEDLAQTFGFSLQEDQIKQMQAMRDALDGKTRQILNERGVVVLETPQIELRTLIDMAVKKIRPFEEKGEKGFMDSVALFTILEQAKKDQVGSHLLVAHDQVYRHSDAAKLSEQYGVELVVIESIFAAVEELENYAKLVQRAIAEYNKQRLRDFLQGEIVRISDFIKQNAEFTSSALNQGGRLGGFMPQILGVTDIAALAIGEVTRGTLPEEADQGRVKISFSVRANAVVKIKKFTFPPEPRFKAGEVASGTLYSATSSGLLAAALLDDSELKAVELEVSVEGSVLLMRRPDENGRKQDVYSDLQLEGVSP